MGTVNSLSETREESEFVGSHLTNPTSQNDSNAVTDMKHPADSKVFRFLNLPAEIRNKIYGNLLVYHKPVELKYSKSKHGEECIFNYKTRLGLFPQICRTSKSVACESFAVLYGENTFHFTAETNICLLKYTLGLCVYSHFFKTIMVDVFESEFGRELEEYTNPTTRANFSENEKLHRLSQAWVQRHVSIRGFPNLKKLCLNLPQGLEILTQNNEDLVLEIKQKVPHHATIEFCGATPNIATRLTAAWLSHVPKTKPPKSDSHPFKPLEWYMEQERKREQKCELPAPPASTHSTPPITALKRPALDSCPTEEPRANKRQKFNDGVSCYGSMPLSDSAKGVGKILSTIEMNAQLVALEKKKGAQECTLDALEKEKDAHKRALGALKKEAKTHMSALIALKKERDAHECALGAVEEKKSSLERSLDAVKEEKSSLECKLHGFSVVGGK
ncbi:hypothetical protein VF21_07610 [Pseudogymnoascus sp. 05NY08]|nr:hypothetical protein VF21_07610 [Pseudogymnoascus sp. 05NY08]